VPISLSPKDPTGVEELVDFIALCAPLLLLGLTFALDHVERWLTASKPKTRTTGRPDGAWRAKSWRGSGQR
jgi:hypothetical protein